MTFSHQRFLLHQISINMDVAVYPHWSSYQDHHLTVFGDTLYLLYKLIKTTGGIRAVDLARWETRTSLWVTLLDSQRMDPEISSDDWITRILTDLPTLIVLGVL